MKRRARAPGEALPAIPAGTRVRITAGEDEGTEAIMVGLLGNGTVYAVDIPLTNRLHRATTTSVEILS